MKHIWNETEPPRVPHKIIRLKYQYENSKPRQGKFYWVPNERAFCEVCNHQDGIGLYLEDGWKILGWEEVV